MPTPIIQQVHPVSYPLLDVVTVANPAAGADLVYTADRDITIMSLCLRIVTDGNVANRILGLKADDGTNIYWRGEVNFSQVASTTTDYALQPGSFDGRALNNVVCAAILPPQGLQLRNGGRLSTIVASKQVGDQISLTVFSAFKTR